MSTADEGRSSYLDLLISTLMEHEKNMDRILDKMQRVSSDMLKATKKAGAKPKKEARKEKEEEEKAGGPGDIIYLRIKAGRPLEEVLEVLRTLKE